jgi:hypothetical protein
LGLSFSLPVEHAFCAKCAEEDGKDLQYRFNFALLMEDPDQSDNGSQEDPGTRIPVVVRGEEANRFLHGFHPKDVKNRKSTQDRLKKRLLPLLGSECLKLDTVEQEPLPFLFAVQTRKAVLSDGSLRPRYFLTNTRLGKTNT